MRFLCKCLTVAMIALMLISAQAATIENSEYTNVPGTTTQDAVISYNAEILLNKQNVIPWNIEVLEPDELTVDTLTDIYDFVLDNDVMPARYFPEDVQQEIRDILGGADPEILHMTEFMSVLPDAVAIEDGHAHAKVEFDVEYLPGQLVVVMFGDIDEVDLEMLTQEEIRQIEWTPLPAEVTETGLIEFDIPHTLLMDIQGQQTMFNVLTDRIGNRGTGDSGVEEETHKKSIPSKDAEDMTVISDVYYNADGEILPDDFRIFITEKTPLMQEEIQRIRRFMLQDEKDPTDDLPISRWFSEATLSEISLLIEEDFDLETLLAYEIKAVADENYIDTYGDVRADFQFATPYWNGQTIVSVLGVPSENPVNPDGSLMDWTVLRTVVENDLAKITFKQLLLPVMEEESLLLIVLSEPFDPVTTEQ